MGTESVELNNSVITILHSHISILFTKYVDISQHAFGAVVGL